MCLDHLFLLQLCISLGWKPKYGRFDVLPLVLQANGQDPELFEIPPHLAQTVKIKHPRQVTVHLETLEPHSFMNNSTHTHPRPPKPFVMWL